MIEGSNNTLDFSFEFELMVKILKIDKHILMYSA